MSETFPMLEVCRLHNFIYATGNGPCLICDRKQRDLRIAEKVYKATRKYSNALETWVNHNGPHPGELDLSKIIAEIDKGDE